MVAFKFQPQVCVTPKWTALHRKVFSPRLTSKMSVQYESHENRAGLPASSLLPASGTGRPVPLGPPFSTITSAGWGPAPPPGRTPAPIWGLPPPTHSPVIRTCASPATPITVPGVPPAAGAATPNTSKCFLPSYYTCLSLFVHLSIQ